jgi:hypothetical protein
MDGAPEIIERAAHDAWLLAGYDGPNETAARELGWITLTASQNSGDAKPDDPVPQCGHAKAGRKRDGFGHEYCGYCGFTFTSKAETKVECTCKPVTTNLPHMASMSTLDPNCPVHGYTYTSKIGANDAKP